MHRVKCEKCHGVSWYSEWTGHYVGDCEYCSYYAIRCPLCGEDSFADDNDPESNRNFSDYMFGRMFRRNKSNG